MSSRRFRNHLVVIEVALGITLLVGAGLLLKSFSRLTDTDPGFAPSGLLTMMVTLPQSGYEEPSSVQNFYHALLERAGSLPGVSATSLVHVLPLSARNADASFEIDGLPDDPGAQSPNADYRVASASYFKAMGIPLLEGSVFEEPRESTSPVEVVVSQSLARLYWPNSSPVGQRVRFTSAQPWMNVVGVVGDVHHRGLNLPARPSMYLPLAVYPLGRAWIAHAMTLTLQSSIAPPLLTSQVRAEIRALDPGVPVSDIRTMTDIVATSVAGPRFTAVLVSGFALVALLLTAVGVYGVLSHMVAGRTREIGLRVALGADGAEVRWMVMRQSLILVGRGLLLGMAGAWAVARGASGLLYGVRPGDPIIYAAASVVLIGVTMLASFVPSRRATRIDPIVALRSD